MADRQECSRFLAAGNAKLWYERFGQANAPRRGSRIAESSQVLMRADVLRDQLAKSLKTAAEQGDERASGILRLLLAAINERDHCARMAGHGNGISEDAILDMIRGMVAQRQAEIGRCESGARLDVAEQEEQEIEVLQRFLPAALSDDQITAAVDEAIAGLGATKLKDMGPVLAFLKERFHGTMNVSRAKQLLCDRLS